MSPLFLTTVIKSVYFSRIGDRVEIGEKGWFLGGYRQLDMESD